MLTFDMKVEDFTKNFGKFEEGICKSLGHIGGYCRRVMRNSIKEGSGHAPMNSPPLSHMGLLKDFIYYAVDKADLTVTIGPAKINRPGRTPEVLEYGGPSTIKVGFGANEHLEDVYIPARPYARPALLETQTHLAEIIKDSITGFNFEQF